jgi:RNA polymerase sigma-70 factor (ECF subfamily)
MYARCGAPVRAYALRRVPPAVADDVVGEVFVVAWRKLDELPAEPLPWLLGCARRVIANHVRGERRRRALLDRLRASSPPAGSAGMVDASGISAEAQAAGRAAGVLARALGELSEGDREVLMLVAWEGLTAAQVGEVLGCSEGAAAMRLHRARRRLATILERERSEVV